MRQQQNGKGRETVGQFQKTLRHDGRGPHELRPVTFQRHFTKHAGGSVLVSFGHTRVLCTAMIERDLPPWLKAKGAGAGGWLTAEYAMLPSSTLTRKKRDSSKPDGRSVEIQRLIGRALRSCIDLKQLEGAGGGLTLFVDCDVLQADGGTRTAAITGAWTAVADAVAAAKKAKLLPEGAEVLRQQVAAVSVGIVKKAVVLDLDYVEDVDAEVDMNVAMLGDGTFVEVQGTGEHATFSEEQLREMLA
ncbi:MAG TPA: ribonuclease PH, partial [Phycisphaerae bacterium]|nr:ribonuclease PH [Phycisphaerae bacterium]